MSILRNASYGIILGLSLIGVGYAFDCFDLLGTVSMAVGFITVLVVRIVLRRRHEAAMAELSRREAELTRELKELLATKA